jgi:exosortase
MNSPVTPSGQPGGSRRMLYILCGTLMLTFLGFYAFVPKFSVNNVNPTLQWLYEAWNNENQYYEHGWIVVAVMGWFIYRAWAPMRSEPVRGSNAGLWWIALGILFWVGGFRAIQARAAVVSLPCLILGGAHFVYGWKVARHLVFPLSLSAFMVPLPGIEQATNGLAIIATKMAHKFGMLIGIETFQTGTILQDAEGGSFSVNDGCSGLRSLVALMLISYAYAMVVHRKWWERFVIFAAAIPIAMVANGVRITTILIVAQINRTFATGTWHNYSGFFSFAAALGLLMLLSFIMRQGVRALRPPVKVTRIGETAAGNAPTP